MSPGPQSTQVPAVILELREQHRAIMNLFEQCALAKDGHAQMESSRSLCREIRLHISVEIGVFYPAVAREMGIPAILAEAGVASLPTSRSWSMKLPIQKPTRMCANRPSMNCDGILHHT